MLTEFPGDRGEWLGRVGKHSKNLRVDATLDETLVFAVLEAIDFQCWKYGCVREPSEEMCKQWLVENKTAIREMKIEPPSYLGLMAGQFDFLGLDK